MKIISKYLYWTKSCPTGVHTHTPTGTCMHKYIKYNFNLKLSLQTRANDGGRQQWERVKHSGSIGLEVSVQHKMLSVLLTVLQNFQWKFVKFSITLMNVCMPFFLLFLKKHLSSLYLWNFIPIIFVDNNSSFSFLFLSLVFTYTMYGEFPVCVYSWSPSVRNVTGTVTLPASFYLLYCSLPLLIQYSWESCDELNSLNVQLSFWSMLYRLQPPGFVNVNWMVRFTVLEPYDWRWPSVCVLSLCWLGYYGYTCISLCMLSGGVCFCFACMFRGESRWSDVWEYYMKAGVLIFMCVFVCALCISTWTEIML